MQARAMGFASQERAVISIIVGVIHFIVIAVQMCATHSHVCRYST